MSTRTIIEINHDQLHRLQNDPSIMQTILRELGMSVHGAALNEANARGYGLDIGDGVQILLQRHHSTETTIKTDYAEVKA